MFNMHHKAQSTKSKDPVLLFPLDINIEKNNIQHFESVTQASEMNATGK